MSVTAAILLIISAWMHAGWNFLGKKSHSSIASFLAAAGLGMIILLPFPIIYFQVLKMISGQIWLLILLTGAFQAIYYASLASGYRTGDMSIVYPMARSIPAVLVVLISLLTGRADRLSVLIAAGILLIVAGSVMLPMKDFHDFGIKKYYTAALVFALCAAIGTSGYSIVDSRALSLLRTATQAEYRTWQVTGVFIFFEGVSSVFWLAVIALILPRERRAMKRMTGKTMSGAMVMGFGIYSTYLIVLVSMAFVRDVSYVVAFRPLSIPIGVLLSAVLLKEKIQGPRLIGMLFMFAGVILVGLG